MSFYSGKFYTLNYQLLYWPSKQNYFCEWKNKEHLKGCLYKAVHKDCLYKAVHRVLTCQWLNIPMVFYSNMSKLFWSIHSVVKKNKKKPYIPLSGLLGYLVSDLYIWLLVDQLWLKFTSSNKFWSRMCVNLMHFPFTSTQTMRNRLTVMRGFGFVLTGQSCWAANTTIFRQLLIKNLKVLQFFLLHALFYIQHPSLICNKNYILQ